MGWRVWLPVACIAFPLLAAPAALASEQTADPAPAPPVRVAPPSEAPNALGRGAVLLTTFVIGVVTGYLMGHRRGGGAAPAA